MDRFDIMMPRVRPGQKTEDTGRTGQQAKTQEGSKFAELLAEAEGRGRVKFSAHAVDRMQSRGIGMEIDELKKVEDAIDQLETKGGKQGLILTDKASLVVSVDNRTVITAVDRGDEGGRVFTNIDSAVIVR